LRRSRSSSLKSPLFVLCYSGQPSFPFVAETGRDLPESWQNRGVGCGDCGAALSRHQCFGRSGKGRPFSYREFRAVAQPLMPHATASWLVDNTSLTFKQIADFAACTSWKCRRSPTTPPPPS
jgi:hypothetical protein